MSKLVIFRGDAVEHEIHLAGRTVRIGRDNRNDIVLDDKSVSRFHAEVRAEGDTVLHRRFEEPERRLGERATDQGEGRARARCAGDARRIRAGARGRRVDGTIRRRGRPCSVSTPWSSAATADQPDRPSRSATQRWSTQSPAASAQALGGFLVGAGDGDPAPVRRHVRRRSLHDAAGGGSDQAALDPPPAPPEPQPPSAPPPVDPTREAIDRHLADARAAMESSDYAAAPARSCAAGPGARPCQPGGARVEAAGREVAAAAQPPRVRPLRSRSRRARVETPGISRRAGEAWPDYTSRAQRIQVNFQEGNRQPRADRISRSRSPAFNWSTGTRRAITASIRSSPTRRPSSASWSTRPSRTEGGTSRRANSSDALKWYQRARAIRRQRGDCPRQDRGADRASDQGRARSIHQGRSLQKTERQSERIEFYKQAADLLPANHEKSREALEWLEKLKP